MFKPGVKPPSAPAKPGAPKGKASPALLKAQAAALRRPKAPPMAEPDGDEGKGY